jgi:F-type H+-transporting ATPase subunit b
VYYSPWDDDARMGTWAMTSTRKLIATGLFGLLLLIGSGASANAQEQSSPQPSQASQQQQSKQQPQPEVRQQHEGIGRELARETREAAGEEGDENAVFKQSTSVRLVSKWTGMNLQHAYWLCVLVNFLVIAGLIFWAGQKFLPKIFRDRTAAIQKAMQEAQKASEEARRRLAEIENRLMKLDVEIGMMRDSAEKEAAGEEARIQASAQEEARKIVQSAEQEIAAAAKAARRALTAYAGDLAVGLAQKQIHVDAATDQVLVRNFSGDLTAGDSNNRARRSGS